MKTKHVWITQYALTRGIEEYQSVEVDGSGNASVPDGNTSWGNRFVRAVHVHFSLADAQKRAEKMRRAKIDLLNRQTTKLIHLQIKVVQR